MTDEEDIKEKFSAYLTRMWLEAPARLGRNRPVSQSEMARLIGIPQGSFNQYINRVRLPDERNRDRLASFFGVEVYDILEAPRKLPPDEDLNRLVDVWTLLPPEERKQIVDHAVNRSKFWQEKMSPK